MGASKTSKYYAANPKAAEKRREYQRELNKTDESKKYRAEHVKVRREEGIYGKVCPEMSKKKNDDFANFMLILINLCNLKALFPMRNAIY